MIYAGNVIKTKTLQNKIKLFLELHTDIGMPFPSLATGQLSKFSSLRMSSSTHSHGECLHLRLHGKFSLAA